MIDLKFDKLLQNVQMKENSHSSTVLEVAATLESSETLATLMKELPCLFTDEDSSFRDAIKDGNLETVSVFLVP